RAATHGSARRRPSRRGAGVRGRGARTSHRREEPAGAQGGEGPSGARATGLIAPGGTGPRARSQRSPPNLTRHGRGHRRLRRGAATAIPRLLTHREDRMTMDEIVAVVTGGASGLGEG